MKRWILAGTSVVVAVLPGVAQAKPVTSHHRAVYLRLRGQVIRQDGVKEAGRNILRDGLSNGKPVTDAVVVHSIQVYERDLHPHSKVGQAVYITRSSTPTYTGAHYYSAPTTSTYAPQQAAPVSSSSGGGGGGLPTCTWQPESGGDPTAVNASSGAGGYYQIMPSTWTSYGGSGLPQNASMSEQTRIAQAIYATQGASAWSRC